MDNINFIIEVVSSVGFPIFVAVVMIDQNKKTADGYKDLYIELKSTIDNNTKIIDELIREMQDKKWG